VSGKRAYVSDVAPNPPPNSTNSHRGVQHSSNIMLTTSPLPSTMTRGWPLVLFALFLCFPRQASSFFAHPPLPRAARTTAGVCGWFNLPGLPWCTRVRAAVPFLSPLHRARVWHHPPMISKCLYLGGRVMGMRSLTVSLEMHVCFLIRQTSSGRAYVTPANSPVKTSFSAPRSWPANLVSDQHSTPRSQDSFACTSVAAAKG